MGKWDNRIKGRISNDPVYQDLRIDASTHTLQTIAYEHHEIHAGSMFYVMYGVASLGAMTTPDDMITLTWTTGNTSGKQGHFEFTAEGPAGARVRFIEGSTGGGASPTGQITILNHNRQLAATKTSEWTSSAAANQVDYDATLLTGGTTLWDSYIPGATIGQTGSGTQAKRDELVLKENTKYQLSIFSTTTEAAYLYINWYEHLYKG